MPVVKHLPKSRIQRARELLCVWLRRAEVDRAVFFGVMASSLQLISAPITLLLIARYVTPETQGFYYTFGSLLALQTYFELGLSVVVLNSASHEWAGLRLDDNGRMVGDPDALSRLVSLGRFIFRWYAIASLVFVLGVGIAGYVFFSQDSHPGIPWRSPWFALVVLSGLLLLALPFNALLEGCNQVATIQKFRLSQIFFRNLALWLTLVFGGGLWALVAAAGISVLRDLYLLGVQYRRFFQSFFTPVSNMVLNWKTEIWPMQWRLALGGIVSFFLFQAFNPVMFHYHGPVAAGRMGMTLAVVTAFQSLPSQWLAPKVPRFGMLIARRDYANLDCLWLRTTRAVFFVSCLGALAAWLGVWGLNALKVPIADRLLSPLPLGLFLLGSIFLSIGYCETTYLRAHKREPLMVLSIVTSLLMGGLVWWLGSQYGAMGAAVAYLIVIGAVSLPWETVILLRCRATWHAPVSAV